MSVHNGRSPADVGTPMADHSRATPQQEISTAIAGLYKQHIGRGPTKVVTVVAHDAVFCVVEDTGIPYERTLLELGADDLIHAGRTRLQHFIAEHLIGTVEAVTGRRVRAHVPGYSAKVDAATEVFLLDGRAVVDDSPTPESWA